MKLEANYKARSVAREVVVHIPVPVDADTPEFRPSIGIAKYRPPLSVVEWTVR